MYDTKMIVVGDNGKNYLNIKNNNDSVIEDTNLQRSPSLVH